MRIIRLTCDYMENPIGFDFDCPTLGWRTESDAVCGWQTEYRIQVAQDVAFETVLLDTGWVESEVSAGVRMEMKCILRTRYFWRVCIRDNHGNESGWSEPAFFETAKYDEPWQAKWIGWDREFPQLRGEFVLQKPVKSARAYACGVGQYAMFFNGERVGDERLAPGFTAYDSWIQYQTYDLTAQVRQGKNAVGCVLGNGYYKGRVNWPEIRERFGDRWNIFGDRLAFLCEIHVVYCDGTEETFVTDERWKAAASPYLRTEIYDGVVFDARMIQENWCEPEFDTSDWDRVSLVAMREGLLQARRGVPVKLHEMFRPQRVIHTPADECVLDFGQNLAGILAFETDAPAGTELLFQFGEALDQHGNFYRDNMRTALAEIRYTADGEKRYFCPEFTFFGYRYVKVSGWPGEIRPECFESRAIYSDMRATGCFTCSDERVNRLIQNSIWSQKSNFVDIPTDCPQRDERMGWTGDAQVFCRTASMHMDTAAFFRKYLYDLAVEQAKDGYVPVTVPNYLRKTGIWQLPITGWADAATIIPWTMYVHFADKAVLEAQYSSMKAWVEYMRRSDTLGVDRYYGFHLGDWLAQDTKDPDNFFGLTPTELIATAYYALSTQITAKAARVLNCEEDAAKYERLYHRVRDAFRREFVTKNGRVVSETQTAQAIALLFDLLDVAEKPTAVEHLAERIRIDHVRLTTGFLGTPYLCPALSENGLNEYAYALLLQPECPGWLYEVEMGATTTWERWNSVRPDGSFGPVGMNSLNHYAFGAICEWLYRYVAGINPTEAAPGFKRSLLRPMPNSALSCACAEVDTPYGTLFSAWELKDGMIQLEFRIPFNMKAEIVLPDVQGCEVRENGNILQQESVLERGSGVWIYEYVPNGATIDRRVPPEQKPDI